MAIFTFNCEDHGHFKVFLKKGEAYHKCNKCDKRAGRILKAGSVIVKDVIDNGLMARAIEQDADINEVMSERIEKSNNRGDGDII